MPSTPVSPTLPLTGGHTGRSRRPRAGRLALLGLLAAAPLLGHATAGDPTDPTRLTRTWQREPKVRHPAINEMSGIVRSRRSPDVWWVHNDSGDEARLFPINARGELIMPAWRRPRDPAKRAAALSAWPGLRLPGAVNIDWEDIATDGERLFIADMGNNGNARRDLGVYVLNEPNPRAIDRARPMLFLPIRYPDQRQTPAKAWHFDCESLFWLRGKLWFLTKHRVAGQIGRLERGSKLYRLDTWHVDRENVLTPVDAHPALAAPTAADVSPDGRTLAVLCIDAVWLFTLRDGDDTLLSGPSHRIAFATITRRQVESLCFDDATHLRITNEQRDMWTIDLTPGRPTPGPAPRPGSPKPGSPKPGRPKPESPKPKLY